MTTPQLPSPEEERFEHLLGTWLRIGVITAALVVLAGGILYLVRHSGERAGFKTFTGEPAALKTPGGIVADVITLRSQAVIQLGILLLIATPVARVILSILGFARQRDWVYVLVTLFVLAVLLYSLLFEGP